MKAFAKINAQTAGIALVDVPKPEAGAQELLVRICAVGVGVHDEYYHPADAAYPYVIGIEAAGRVEAIGDGVNGYTVGQRIAFVSAMQPKGGTWAEYAVISQTSLIIPIPDGLSFEQATVVPVAGSVALKAFRALELKASETIFIAGGSGAIGSLAIQIAVSRGLRVAASASMRNHEYLRQLGVELMVDYHDKDWQRNILQWAPRGVSAAIAVQPGTAAQSEPVVADNGVIVAVSGDQLEAERGIRVEQIPHTADIKDELIEMLQRASEGALRLEMQQVYPFADGLSALAKVKTRHVRGKLVLRLAP